MQQKIGNHGTAASNSLQTRLSLRRASSGTSSLPQAAARLKIMRSAVRTREERRNARQTGFEKAREQDDMVQPEYSIDDNPCTAISQSRIIHYHGLPALVNAPKMVEWRWSTWNILVVALITIHAQTSLMNVERLN
jgi:hypothetical protein